MTKTKRNYLIAIVSFFVIVCSLFMATITPAMAKAGSGDVLSGIICGVAARTEDLMQAVVSSAYIFGRAGEIADKKSNEYSVIATDIISCIPDAINSLSK